MEERKIVLVDREELEEAFEFVSFGGDHGGHRAWISMATGKITFYSDDLGNLDAGADDDADEEEEDDEDESGTIAIPGKKELGLGSSLVMRFAREVMPDDYGTIARFFDRRGAYARLKDFLQRRDMLQRWYDFEEQATKQAILEWCKENDVGFRDEPKRDDT
ncbi:MAG TPA: UPF0158 family protein [Acetobacteraceae bacterium]|nr:UPF0158 family protein [Acetobacteraceae bacterium]